jgi:hypothetical protein
VSESTSIEKRDKNRAIKVLVTPEERVRIERRARGASMTLSAYLRTLGLGYEPKSTLDWRTVADLVQVHADQGRLGGLLKLWLVEKPGQGAPVFDVRRLLRQIEESQAQLKAIVAGLRGRRG